MKIVSYFFIRKEESELEKFENFLFLINFLLFFIFVCIKRGVGQKKLNNKSSLKNFDLYFYLFFTI